MSHGLIFVFRLLLALYGFILEFLLLSSFKFMELLPPVIRDRAEESLKLQTQAISYWSAILSLGWCLVIVDIIIICLLFIIVIVLPKVLLDPAFRAQAIQAILSTKEKEANAQEKGSKSKSNFLLIGYLFTVVTLAKYAIFPRSLEDAASTASFNLDGALARFHFTLYNAARTLPITITAFVYASVFAVWTVYRTRKRQQRDKAEEETRFSSVEKAQEIDSVSDSDSDGGQKGFFEEVDPWTMLL